MPRLSLTLLALALALLVVALVVGARWHLFPALPVLTANPRPVEMRVTLIASPQTTAEKIVNGAKQEVINGVRYDASYVQLDYPKGDVPSDRGACTEVIIRGLRNAGYDLQELIHEDMEQNFSTYPNLWGLRAPDANIDHRRVPNHLAFMKRHGKELPLTTNGDDAATWQPGDLVYWRLPDGKTHCGVLSNDRNGADLPLVIHNIGPFASQQDRLTNWEIIGHFRYPNANPTQHKIN